MGIISYAQNFEDILLWRSLGHVTPSGYYIDIGAHHPVDDSVSLLFYEQGWRGIHVEPTANCAKLLRLARPDETIIEALVAEHAGHSAFHEIPGTGLSTARRDIADEHNKKHGYPIHTELVPTLTLDTVLDLAPPNDIHWLKIDVEGFELEVLSGWQKSQRRPWVIVIEATYPNTQIDTSDAWEALVLDKDYKLVYKDGLNRFYLSQEHPELEEHFALPPNIFDDFQLSDNPHWLTRSVKDAHNRKIAANQEERTVLQRQLQDAHATIEQLRHDAPAPEHHFDNQIAEHISATQQQVEANSSALLEAKSHHRARLVEALEQTREAEKKLLAMHSQIERVQAEAQSRERLLSSLVESKTLELRRKETELLQAALEREHQHVQASRADAEHATSLEHKLCAATQLIASLQSDLSHAQDLRQEQTASLRTELGAATNRIGSLRSNVNRLQSLVTALTRRNQREVRLAQLAHTEQVRELEIAQTERLLAMRREFEAWEHRLNERQSSELDRLQADHRAREDALLQQQSMREAELQEKLENEMAILKANFEQRFAALQAQRLQSDELTQNLSAKLAVYRQLANDFAAQIDIIKRNWYGPFISRLQPVSRALSAAQSISFLNSTNSPASHGYSVIAPIDNTMSLVSVVSDAARQPISSVSEQGARSGFPLQTKMRIGDILSLADEAFVRTAFLIVLGREADATGLGYYLNRLNAGYSKPHILRDIVRSDEAKVHARQPDLATLPDLEFVDAAYQRILGRPADAEGKRHYMELLRSSGNREQVLQDIQSSKEAMTSGMSVLAFEQELTKHLREEKRQQRWWKRGARLEKKLAALEQQLEAISTNGIANLEHQMRALGTGIDQLSNSFAVLQQGIRSAGPNGNVPFEPLAISHVQEIETSAANNRTRALSEVDTAIWQPLPSRARTIFLKLRNQKA
ncbi:FkbM family methyltransferase [Paraburkholderia youngii]|uniref:FkbM family methyltransferase n=1 Tax=Paraburkholderia youngii TaxID=2782701 RepID=UPI00158FEA80|nr:FkbM family methyltransferase [Paraburkholderia youngii]NUX58108.1 FkbM family methyltransferase [Paraburkholderia youngii]